MKYGESYPVLDTFRLLQHLRGLVFLTFQATAFYILGLGARIWRLTALAVFLTHITVCVGWGQF